MAGSVTGSATDVVHGAGVINDDGNVNRGRLGIGADIGSEMAVDLFVGADGIDRVGVVGIIYGGAGDGDSGEIEVVDGGLADTWPGVFGLDETGDGVMDGGLGAIESDSGVGRGGGGASVKDGDELERNEDENEDDDNNQDEREEGITPG